MRPSWALALALTACPAGESRVSTATWTLEGAVRATHAVDDRDRGRVTCTVDRDPSDPLDTAPTFTLAIVADRDGRDGPGVYLTVRAFAGPATYEGGATAFDAATLERCADDDDARCFAAADGCSLVLERWELGDVIAPGVRNGTGAGRFDCSSLENPSSEQTLRIAGGTFTCRASDWTAAR